MIATKCPLCEADLDSLWHPVDQMKSDFHYRCSGCHHGWYVADLQNIDYMRLNSKTDAEIRDIILKEDKEVKDD